MWKLEVYPSLMEVPAIEKYNRSGSLADFLKEAEIEWEGREYQPIVVTVNGKDYPIESWKKKIKSGSIVKICVVPSGFIGKLIGKILGFIMKIFGGGKKQNARVDTGQARTLESVAASNNQPKLGDVVPEILGTFRKYPDYLVQPRRYFEGADPRVQTLEFHACVGVGQFEIDSQDVKVGNTAFADVGDSRASYVIYEPNADLTGVTTNDNWYNSPEVGAATNGSTGIDLNSETLNFNNIPAPASYTFAEGNKVTRSDGAWPAAWEVGTIVRVTQPNSYFVQHYFNAPGSNGRTTVVTGNFKHLAPVFRQTVGSGFFSSLLLRLRWVEASFKLEADSGANLNGPVDIQWIDESLGTARVTFYGKYGTNNAYNTISFYDPNAGFKITEKTSSYIKFSRVLSNVADYGDYYSYVADGSFRGFVDMTAATTATVSFLAAAAYGARSAIFTGTPAGELTGTIELDFFFPSGLSKVEDNGALTEITVSVLVEITDQDSGQSESVTYSFSSATIDQIGFTRRIRFGPYTKPSPNPNDPPREFPGLFGRNIRPLVAVRRISQASTSTSINDKVVWYGLKSMLPNRTRYPNWTTIGVKLRSGGKLSGNSESGVNLIAKRKIEPAAGGARRVSSRIEDYVAYIAKTAGYTAAQLDIEELTRLGSKWADRGDYFNHIFDETTVQAAISTVLGAGYAELTVENGRLKPVRDEVRTGFEHAYSPQNMLSGGLDRQFKSPRPDDIDGVEVDYLDTETWTRKTVVCTLPGSLRTRLKKIKIDGVGDKTRAWRAGMRELRQEKYRIWGYSFSTELDAMCSSYLSYVPIYDDIPKYMQTAMVEGSTSTAGVTYITISEEVKYAEYGASPLVCAMRRRDGTSTEFMTIERDTSLAPNVVKIPASEYAKLPEQLKQATYNHDLGTGEPLHIFIGIANRLCFPALIVDISPSGYNKTNVKAVNYDARVYADDDNQPPLDA